MRQFLVLVRQNKELREEVEERLARSFQKFMLARAVMSAEAVEEAIMFPQVQLEVQLAIQNIMSVHTPKISWQQVGETSASIYPYALPRHQASWTTPSTLCLSCCRSCWSWLRSRQP